MYYKVTNKENSKRRRTQGLLTGIILALFYFVLPVCGLAQIGIETDNPNPSALLDITSSNKGLLVPRVSLSTSLTNPSPVNSPATGLLVYNTGNNQTHGFYYWTGSRWKMLKPAEVSDVEGPSSSTDNAVARFDGSDGQSIQNSQVILDDLGNITGVNNLTTSGFTMTTGAGTDKVMVSDASGNGHWDEALPLDVQQDDVTIVDGANTLNFEGNVTVTDEGNNKATVSVGSTTSEEKFIQVSSTTSMDVNVVIPVAIPWDMETFKDATEFTHSNSSNPSRIYVNQHGLYEVNYMFSIVTSTNKRKTIRARLRKNGSNYVTGSASYSFIYSNTDDKSTHTSSSFLVELNTNDFLEVMVNRQTNDGAVTMIPNESLFYVRVMRTW